MLFHVFGPSEVESLWKNATSNCSQSISKECLNLCVENILKVCLQVRCFSCVKDIINKYELKKPVLIRKGLKNELKSKQAGNMGC